MAISYIFPFLVGTTAERTGGTFTNLQVGWFYAETDGKVIYRWNGTSWDLIGSAGGTVAETLINKTLYAESNPLFNVQTSPFDTKQVAMWHGPLANNTCASGYWAVALTNNLTGTGGWTVNNTTTRVNARATTGNTINSLCGMRSSSLLERGDLNPVFGMRAALVSTADVRAYIGYWSSTSAAASTSDPLNVLSGVGFFYDSSVDSNWHIAQNDGSGASDRTTINAGAAGTTIKDFWLRYNGTNWQYSYATKGTAFPSITWTNIVTDVPLTTTGLTYLWYVECLQATNSKSIDFFGGVGWHNSST